MLFVRVFVPFGDACYHFLCIDPPELASHGRREHGS